MTQRLSMMSRLTLALICLIIVVQGHLTRSSVLAADENDGGANSLLNAENGGSLSMSKPNGGDLPSPECDVEAFDATLNVAVTETLPYPYPIRCKPGYVSNGRCCVPCRPGTYWVSGKCQPCAPGSYSNTKASLNCLPCTGRTVAPLPGSSYCTPCNRGWYAVDGIICVWPDIVIKCLPGYTLPKYGTYCVPCAPGTYEESGKCKACAPGTFSSEGASTKCLLCTDFGSLVAPNPGSVSCDRCDRPFSTVDGINCNPPPTVSPTPGTPSMKPSSSPTRAPSAIPTCGAPVALPTPSPVTSCLAGYEFNGKECVACRPGSYWESGKCVPCKPGTYNDVGASMKCLPCIGGTIAPLPGSSYCKPCNRGWYAVDGIICVWSDIVIKCLPGYTLSKHGTDCVPCAPGTYEESGKCKACAPGTFSSEEASTKCLLCIDFGSLFAPNPGSISCDRCDRPFSTDGGINCNPPPNICAVTSMRPSTVPTYKPSPAPTTIGGIPTTSPTPSPFRMCGVGYYFDGINMVPCPRGTYWRFFKCYPCEPGTYNPYLGSGRCLACGKGAVATLPGSTECCTCNIPWYTLDSINCIYSSAPTQSPSPAGHPTAVPYPIIPPTKPFKPPLYPPNKPPSWWCEKNGGCVADQIESKP